MIKGEPMPRHEVVAVCSEPDPRARDRGDGEATDPRPHRTTDGQVQDVVEVIPLAGRDDVESDQQLISWARHAAGAANGIICAVARLWTGGHDLPPDHDDK